MIANERQGTISAPATRSSWMLETWRLTCWYCLLARRQLLSKVLLTIFLGGFVLFVVIQAVIYYNVLSLPASSSKSSICSSKSMIQAQTLSECISLREEQEARTRNIQFMRAQLVFPTSLGMVSGYLSLVGLLLLTILAGVIAGNEYNLGTQKMMIARGIRFDQILLAQVLFLALLACGATLGSWLLGSIVGLTIGPVVGGSIPSIPLSGWVEIGGAMLAQGSGLFAFLLIALFGAAVGRSVVASLVISLGYLPFENILATVSHLLGTSLANGTGVAHVSDWLLQANTSALTALSMQTPLALTTVAGGSSNTISVRLAHALLVVLVYCLFFIFSSYCLLRRENI